MLPCKVTQPTMMTSQPTVMTSHSWRRPGWICRSCGAAGFPWRSLPSGNPAPRTGTRPAGTGRRFRDRASRLERVSFSDQLIGWTPGRDPIPPLYPICAYYSPRHPFFCYWSFLLIQISSRLRDPIKGSRKKDYKQKVRSLAPSGIWTHDLLTRRHELNRRARSNTII